MFRQPWNTDRVGEVRQRIGGIDGRGIGIIEIRICVGIARLKPQTVEGGRKGGEGVVYRHFEPAKVGFVVAVGLLGDRDGEARPVHDKGFRESSDAGRDDGGLDRLVKDRECEAGIGAGIILQRQIEIGRFQRIEAGVASRCASQRLSGCRGIGVGDQVSTGTQIFDIGPRDRLVDPPPRRNRFSVSSALKFRLGSTLS